MKKQATHTNRHKSRYKLITLFWVTLIISGIIGAYFVMQQQMLRFPITTVKINGQITRTSQQEIWDSIANLLNKGFFGTNVAIVREKLQKLPWVETAQVEKIWPDKLAVTVSEKIPIARWRGKGIVTTNGDIVYSDAISDLEKLPIFWGNEHQVKSMLENYLAMLDILKQNDISIAEIEIMPDQGWRAILNNGIMLFLGQEGLRGRLNRFNLAYRNKLQRISNKIDYVDLRYVNGVAIGWKDNISKLYLDQFFNEVDKVNA